MKCFSSFHSFLWSLSICSITHFVRFSTYDFLFAVLSFILNFIFFFQTPRYLWMSSSLFIPLNIIYYYFHVFFNYKKMNDNATPIYDKLPFLNIKTIRGKFLTMQDLIILGSAIMIFIENIFVRRYKFP